MIISKVIALQESNNKPKEVYINLQHEVLQNNQDLLKESCPSIKSKLHYLEILSITVIPKLSTLNVTKMFHAI